MKIVLRLAKSSVTAVIALLPVWVTDASISSVLVYGSIFGGLLIGQEYLGTGLRRLALLTVSSVGLGFGIVVIERSSLTSNLMRFLIISWMAVIATIYGIERLRRVATINIAVLLSLLVLVEMTFRVLRDTESSSQYQIIEIYRSARSDGPGDDRFQAIVTQTPDGLRTTTDQPVTSSGRILVFGGSTTLSGNVNDADTYPSQLQRLLNASGRTLRVENYGVSASTATDRVAALRDVKNLGENDIVLFYIGVNEAGTAFTQRDLPAGVIRSVPELGTAIQKASRYSRIADVLFRALVFGGISVSEESKKDSLDEFRTALSTAEEIARESGAKFIPVLQAHLFTRDPMSEYDLGLAALYSPKLEEIVLQMYSKMLPEVKKYPINGDARAVMNKLLRSPYYDWHHVNTQGNAAIASYLFTLLEDSEMLK